MLSILFGKYLLLKVLGSESIVADLVNPIAILMHHAPLYLALKSAVHNICCTTRIDMTNGLCYDHLVKCIDDIVASLPINTAVTITNRCLQLRKTAPINDTINLSHLRRNILRGYCKLEPKSLLTVYLALGEERAFECTDLTDLNGVRYLFLHFDVGELRVLTNGKAPRLIEIIEQTQHKIARM
jgi:hypothetical protein